MSAARARPFPWEALDRTSREDALALRDARRWAATHLDLGRLRPALEELLGAEVDVRLQAAGRVGAGRPIPGGAAVLLVRPDAAHVARSVLVEVERALAATALKRTARRPPAVALGATAPLPAAAVGAFAAVVVAAARRAHGGAPLRVLSAGPAPALEADVVRLGPEGVALTFTVLVDHDAFEARVVMPREALVAAPSPAWSGHALRSLGSAAIELPVVAQAAWLPVADIARLAAGDVLLLAGWPLGLSQGGRLTGRVHLAAPAAESGVCAELCDDGRLVLRGGLEPLCGPEASVNEIERGELIDAIGDVPVLVRVEIGEARMPAREWASVGVGDVVTLGRRVAEPVVLRVGGVTVARGDLVEIDGEVGVRIVERVAGGGA